MAKKAKTGAAAKRKQARATRAAPTKRTAKRRALSGPKGRAGGGDTFPISGITFDTGLDTGGADPAARLAYVVSNNNALAPTVPPSAAIGTLAPGESVYFGPNVMAGSVRWTVLSPSLPDKYATGIVTSGGGIVQGTQKSQLHIPNWSSYEGSAAASWALESV